MHRCGGHPDARTVRVPKTGHVVGIDHVPPHVIRDRRVSNRSTLRQVTTHIKLLLTSYRYRHAFRNVLARERAMYAAMAEPDHLFRIYVANHNAAVEELLRVERS